MDVHENCANLSAFPSIPDLMGFFDSLGGAQGKRHIRIKVNILESDLEYDHSGFAWLLPRYDLDKPDLNFYVEFDPEPLALCFMTIQWHMKLLGGIFEEESRKDICRSHGSAETAWEGVKKRFMLRVLHLDSWFFWVVLWSQELGRLVSKLRLIATSILIPCLPKTPWLLNLRRSPAGVRARVEPDPSAFVSGVR